MRKIVVITLASLLVLACEKNKVENDLEAPTIEVVEPLLNAEVRKDTTLRITAYLRDNHSIINYSMNIGDENGNPIFGFEYSFSEEISNGDENISDFVYGDNLEISESLTVSEFYLHFSVTDENGNVGELSHKLNLVN